MNILGDPTWINPAGGKVEIGLFIFLSAMKTSYGNSSFGTDLASHPTFYSNQVFLIANFILLNLHKACIDKC